MNIPADTVAMELAIRAWVISATGFTSSNVYWQFQSPPPPRPTGTFITLHLASITNVGGRDWNDYVIVAPPGAAGLEICHYARGVREAVLSIQCFAGPATGVNSARAALELVRAKSRLPTISDALEAAGIGILRFGAVTVIGGEINTTVIEPRATLQAFLSVASDVSELGTSILTVTAPVGTVT